MNDNSELDNAFNTLYQDLKGWSKGRIYEKASVKSLTFCLDEALKDPSLNDTCSSVDNPKILYEHETVMELINLCYFSLSNKLSAYVSNTLYELMQKDLSHLKGSEKFKDYIKKIYDLMDINMYNEECEKPLPDALKNKFFEFSKALIMNFYEILNDKYLKDKISSLNV